MRIIKSARNGGGLEQRLKLTHEEIKKRFSLVHIQHYTTSINSLYAEAQIIIRKYGSTFYIGSFSIKPIQIKKIIFTFIFHSI